MNVWFRRGAFFTWVLTIALISGSCSSPQNPTSSPESSASKAPRVITLAPHLAEWVYALGGGSQLIATVEHSDYPLQAKDLPKIGNAFTLNVEQIIALQPDHILYWPDGGALLQIERIRSLGLSVVPVLTNTLDDLPRAAEAICEALDCADKHQVADALRHKTKRLQAKFRHIPKRRAFLQVGERPLWALGGSHLLSDAMSLCGLTNIFNTLTSSAAVVSPEQVVAARPEVIILNQHALEGDWGQSWSKWWPTKTNDAPRIITLDPDTSVRPGPRVFDAIEAVCLELAREVENQLEQ